MSCFLHHWPVRSILLEAPLAGPAAAGRRPGEASGDPPSSQLPWAGPLETGVGLLSRVLEAGKWPLWQDEAAGLGPAPPPPWAHGQAGSCLGAPGAPELHSAAAAMLGPRPGFWKQDWTFCLWKVGQRVHCCALGDGGSSKFSHLRRGWGPGLMPVLLSG